jgi:hypothetical protein
MSLAVLIGCRHYNTSPRIWAYIRSQDDYQTQLLQAKSISSVEEHCTTLYSVLKKLYFVVDVPVGEELEPLVLSGGDPLVLQHPHHGGGGAPLAARTPHPPEPVLYRARICKRLWSLGIDSASLFSMAGRYDKWVVVTGRQAGNRFLGSLKGLQIRALYSLKSELVSRSLCTLFSL